MAEEGVQKAEDRPAGFAWRAQLDKFRKPGLPQIGLMAGAAAVLALAVALLLWSGRSAYEPLYRGLSEADAGRVMEALQKDGVPFQVDRRTGALTVPEDKVHEARLKLASQGLPRGATNGFELLDQQNGFGVSQFMETARYQRALEGELARSIMSIGVVEGARVHLALPKDSVFVRERQPPSASVLVQLAPGRVLDQGQVAAIVHLVSSSVPRLGADGVSVIDQAGNLLTRSGGGSGLALSMEQLEYARHLEERYARRIEDILTPVLGMGRVRAQVALEVDFSHSEETAERYDPKQPPGMMRSERLLEEASTRPQAAGIPGALSNQPPGVATVPEEVPDQAAGATDAQLQAEDGRALRSRRESTRNYELDRRISHTRQAPGRVLRISTAVVVDDRAGPEQAGEAAGGALSPEELERITALVREAVGFDAARGDTVSVINAAFAASPFAEPVLPMWQQAWFVELVKWGVIAVVALAALLLVVRPVVRRLLPAPQSAETSAQLSGPVAEGDLVTDEEQGLEGLLEDRVVLGAGQGTSQLGGPLEQLDRRLKTAKALVAEDPKRAVQVIKNWINSEA